MSLIMADYIDQVRIVSKKEIAKERRERKIERERERQIYKDRERKSKRREPGSLCL